jgi:mRNA deadenylase 3'-5' endonuclease subunit Ccr4
MLFTICFGLIAIIVFVFIYNNREKVSNRREVIIKPSSKIINEFIHTYTNQKGKETVSVLTYNILCQKYIPKTRRKELTLEDRMATIVNEIKSLDPDIFCIQEANFTNYKKFFLPNFKEYNFGYSENYGSNFINLTGYKKDKYGLIEQNGLIMNDIDINGNRGVFYIKLKSKKTNTPISVYNVHFPWRPIYEVEKCYVLNAVIENVLKDECRNIIIAGDYNSIPNSLVMRLVYYSDFVKELRLYKSYRDDVFDSLGMIKEDDTLFDNRIHRRKAENFVLNKCISSIFETIDKSKRFCNVLNNIKKVHNRFELRSSYDKHYDLDFTKNENRFFLDYINTHPKYTNYTEGFKNTIDYIIHSSNLKVFKILKLPNEFELSREVFLPSRKYPSDHLKLFTEFIIQ